MDGRRVRPRLEAALWCAGALAFALGFGALAAWRLGDAGFREAAGRQAGAVLAWVGDLTGGGHGAR